MADWQNPHNHKYGCPFCGATSASLESMQAHVATEADAEPGKTYSEDELAKAFDQAVEQRHADERAV